jgi:hypothetical protein
MDAEKRTLSGTAKVIGGQAYQIILAGNGFKPQSATASGATVRIEPLAAAKGLFRLTLTSPKTDNIVWKVDFSGDSP